MWPSKFVIFSDITFSNPFSMKKVINNDDTPKERPIIDNKLAVFVKLFL